LIREDSQAEVALTISRSTTMTDRASVTTRMAALPTNLVSA
jgi:hypothetical protein